MADNNEAKKGKDKDKEKEGKGTSKGVMVILFVLGLLVLGSAAFGGVYLFMKTDKEVSSKPVVVENVYVDLGEVTVNLADDGGKRYFKGQISVGYDKKEKKMEEELKNNLVVVKDVVIFYLRSQKAEFLNNTANEEKMKTQLIEAINKELVKGKVDDIRFNSIIVQ